MKYMFMIYKRPVRLVNRAFRTAQRPGARVRTGKVMAAAEAIDAREVEWRMALLRERYGDRFAEPEQEAEVRRQVAQELVRVSRVLREAEIEADHEPFPPFRPYRSDDR